MVHTHIRAHHSLLHLRTIYFCTLMAACNGNLNASDITQLSINQICRGGKKEKGLKDYLATTVSVQFGILDKKALERYRLIIIYLFLKHPQCLAQYVAITWLPFTSALWQAPRPGEIVTFAFNASYFRVHHL